MRLRNGAAGAGRRVDADVSALRGMVNVASVTCRGGEARDQCGGDALIPRGDDSSEHIEGLRLPADHYPGMAVGDSVDDGLGAHFRRMNCQPLVEELR